MLEKMAKEHVLSVPVVIDGKLRGIFDVLDYIALILGEDPVGTMCVAKARNASRHDVCLTVTRSDGLLSLAEVFSRGVHRVCVVDGGVVTGVVSQSDLLAFLARHLPVESGSILDQTLEQAHLVHQAVAVQEDQPLRAALKQMDEKGHEAVAVTSPDGSLIGAVQASFLRGVGPDELHKLLAQPVGKFAKEHAERLVRSTPSATIRNTILFVAKARAHQVWLEDGSRLIGIVTLSDLVRIALKGVSHHHK
jgi:CBS domain-containing protein